MKIGITGANGFIGNYLFNYLKENGDDVIGFVRRNINKDENIVEIEKIDSTTDWYGKLIDIDCLVHCAGIAHLSSISSHSYKEVNILGSLNLMKNASEQGVKRFIYISTAKVMGDVSIKRPFKDEDIPKPIGLYANSKYEAELQLKKVASNLELELVILRPPLVYGPKVKANFRDLMQICNLGIPLPFGGLNNLRSFISLDNLVDLIVKCSHCEEAINRTFLISDDQDLSTKELIIEIKKNMQKKAYLFYFPSPILFLIASLFKREASFNALFRNFQLDIQETKKVLNWEPRFNVSEGIKATSESFLKTHTN